ncbi:MAG: hypothetical protein WCV79_03015 [Candidatus Paceibacterota bacterium]
MKNISLLVLSVVFMAGIVSAATTISTDITTGGQLSVTGTSTFMGNVGIGTTSPNGILHVVSSSFSGSQLFERIAGGSNIPYASLRLLATKATDMGDGFGSVMTFLIQDNAGSANVIADIAAVRAGADGTGDIVLKPATAGAVNERLRVTSIGNVGIGTTTPYSKFHVTSGASATTTSNFGEVGVTSSKSCFNTKNSVGADISFYFVGTAMVVENNLCR